MQIETKIHEGQLINVEQCDQYDLMHCNNTNTKFVVDPYKYGRDGIVEWITLCVDCFHERNDDV